MKRSVEKRSMNGLKGVARKLKPGKPLDPEYSFKTVVLDLKTKRYGAKEVRATRKLLQASQPVFAKFLGVSVRTVRAWEQSINAPNQMACRFMDEIRRNPDYMCQRLRDSVKVLARASAK